MPSVDKLITKTGYSELYWRKGNIAVKKVNDIGPFINEILINLRLSDNDLFVKIYNVGFNEKPYITMPFYRMNLEEFVRKNHGLVGYKDRARRLLMGITRAINHLNIEGVIHGDLKPTNIVVINSEGDPVVIDFGGCRIGSCNGIHYTITYSDPSFACHANPACIKDLSKMDIWSVGMLVYFIAKGHHLLRGNIPKGTCPKEQGHAYKLSVLQEIVDLLGVSKKDVLGFWHPDILSGLCFEGNSMIGPQEVDLGEDFKEWEDIMKMCLRVDPNLRISPGKLILLAEKICLEKRLSIFEVSRMEHQYDIDRGDFKKFARALLKTRAELAPKEKIKIKTIALAVIFCCHITKRAYLPTEMALLCSLAFACVLKEPTQWKRFGQKLLRQEDYCFATKAIKSFIGVPALYTTFVDSIEENAKTEPLLLSVLFCKGFLARNQGMLAIMVKSVIRHKETGFELNSLEKELLEQISKATFEEKFLIHQ